MPSSAPEPDLSSLIATLDRHGVDYVLIGGMAARVYGSTMATQDLDILASDLPQNMERLAAALNELEAHSDLASTASVDATLPWPKSWRLARQQHSETVTNTQPNRPRHKPPSLYEARGASPPTTST